MGLLPGPADHLQGPFPWVWKVEMLLLPESFVLALNEEAHGPVDNGARYLLSAQ